MITGILVYLLSLSTMRVLVKNIFVNHKFNFPKFVTSVHFASCGILCFSIMYYRQATGRKKMPVPTKGQMCRMILPIAFCFATSVGTNNIALVHCTVAFAEIISSATPLCIIIITVCRGEAFDLRLTVPVLSVIVGVCICAEGEKRFTWISFLLVFLATFLRAFKSRLQQEIMKSQVPEERFDPVELLAWMSPSCFATMAIWGTLTEGFEPFVHLTGDQNTTTIVAIGITCVNACVLNVANNFVIRDLGAVGGVLTGQLKVILALLGATLMLGEVIQVQQIVGYACIACGVHWYNRIEEELQEFHGSEELQEFHGLPKAARSQRASGVAADSKRGGDFEELQVVDEVSHEAVRSQRAIDSASDSMVHEAIQSQASWAMQHLIQQPVDAGSQGSFNERAVGNEGKHDRARRLIVN